MQKAQGSVSRPVVIVSQLFIKWLLLTCPLTTVPHHPDIPFECQFARFGSISGLLKYEIAALWNSLCNKHFLEWNAWKCKKAPISDIPRLAPPSQNGCAPSSIGIDNHNIKGKKLNIFYRVQFIKIARFACICIYAHVLVYTLILKASKMWQASIWHWEKDEDQFWEVPGWQKLHGSTSGTCRKVWTRTKLISPNIRYFVAN